MFYQKIIILLLFCTYSTFACATSDTGFDEICRIYAEANNSGMTKEQLSNYIFDNVNERVNVKDAIQAHDAVFNLAPAERYSIFKQSAELSLKREWGCQAIKKLMK